VFQRNILEGSENMKVDFYRENRQKLIEKMEVDSIGIVFSGQAVHRSADADFPFLVNRNFFYLTGLEQENIILIILKKQEEIVEELFINEADPLLEKWVGKRYSKDEAGKISGILKIDWVSKFHQKLINILNVYDYKNIYLDLEINNWDKKDQRGLTFSQEIIHKYPYLDIKNIYPILRDLRTLKSPEEIEKIKSAIDITSKGIYSIMKEMKAGLREYQLEAYFDFAIKYAGARDNAFDTIVASGDNAVILHYIENNDIIESGDLVLFDLGADYQHYCADISRTFPVSGKFTPRQRILYEIVLKAEEEVIGIIKPGLHYSELNKHAKKVLAEECIKIGLIERQEEISKYYYHGVSHYLGLDTHDVGRRDRRLEPGMVITIEPGLYIQEEKIGIRIEDNVLITQDGYEVLSSGIPKTIEEIEKIMK
jgi:Xaa-Pro aminopeptidase